MPPPKSRRRNNGVSFGKRQQIFISCDQVVGLRCKQRSQHRLVRFVAQFFFQFPARLDNLRHEQKAIGKVANLRHAQLDPRVRAKVEWPFRILKRVFGLVKVRYRGLTKNHEWLCAAFALVNLYQNRKRLARINQRLATQGA